MGLTTTRPAGFATSRLTIGALSLVPLCLDLTGLFALEPPPTKTLVLLQLFSAGVAVAISIGVADILMALFRRFGFNNKLDPFVLFLTLLTRPAVFLPAILTGYIENPVTDFPSFTKWYAPTLRSLALLAILLLYLWYASERKAITDPVSKSR